MPSFATLVVFILLALLFVLPKLRVARSNSVQPLPVRIIPPKSPSAVTLQVMVEPLRAPIPCLAGIVVGAQQLSISDPTADVDDLLSSFSSFSMKAPLPRSCLKRDRRTPSHRRVHFQTQIISEVRLIEISPGKTMRRYPLPDNLAPHIPGNTFYQFSSNGQLYMLKTDGAFNSPGPSRPKALRCGAIRNCGSCKSCIRLRQINMCDVNRECQDFHTIRTPRTWPANTPFYT